MKPNIGRTDKIVRITIAIVIAAAGIYFKSWWSLVAIAPFLTAIISFCPVYKIFGLNTSTNKSVQ